MKILEVSIVRSLGFRLLNEIRLDTGLLPKGHVITEDDILMFQIMGLKKIRVIELESGEIEQKTAAGIISAKLCGENTAYTIDDDGIVEISSAVDGHFSADEKRIEKFNIIQRNVILNTIPCYSNVKAGDLIAKLDFSLPLYQNDEINRLAIALSGNTSLLSVEVSKKRKVGLIYVRFYNDKTEQEYFTSVLSKVITETKSLQLDFSKEYFAEFDEHSVANAIDDAIRDGNEIVVLISSMKNITDQDLLVRGIEITADEMVVKYVDVVGASDLFIAVKKNIKIISIPFNYNKVKSSFLNEMIYKAMIREKLLPTDFYVRNNFIEDLSEKVSDKDKKMVYVSSDEAESGDIAVVVLAAGASLRAGKDKLMQEYQGKPLFYNAVQEAVRAKAGPVFLITGGKHEEMTESVQDLDINIVHNLAYREGVKSSIRLGLNHVPNSCKGAILLPADMPHITAAHLNKMIKVFDRSKEKQVVITSYKGIKYNPVLWSKALFNMADVVPENSELRPVLVEFEDVTQLVKVKTAEDVFDVTYPADVQKIS
ncbi:MAG: NTP transferase domain-containing protein [Alphaproteobacteria bacterium]